MSERVNMPPRDGATEWLNSEPVGRAERDHAVLVNFWALDIERVRAATKDGAIDEPVVVDNSLDERPVYELADRLRVRHPLACELRVAHENVVLGRPGGSIVFGFHAGEAHLVPALGTDRK